MYTIPLVSEIFLTISSLAPLNVKLTRESSAVLDSVTVITNRGG